MINQGENKFVFSYTINNFKYMSKLESKVYNPNYKHKHLTNCMCGRSLNLGYIYIIHRLLKTGLLSKDYVPMCCYCNLLACIGFIIPDEWSNVVITAHIMRNRLDLIVFITGYLNKIWFEYEFNVRNIDKVLESGRIFNDVNMH